MLFETVVSKRVYIWIYICLMFIHCLRKRNHVEVGKDASGAHEHALTKLTSSIFFAHDDEVVGAMRQAF